LRRLGVVRCVVDKEPGAVGGGCGWVGGLVMVVCVGVLGLWGW